MGQAWFQGKYIDLNWEGLEHSVAVLKDKSVGAAGAKGGQAVSSGATRQVEISTSLLKVMAVWIVVFVSLMIG